MPENLAQPNPDKLPTDRPVDLTACRIKRIEESGRIPDDRVTRLVWHTVASEFRSRPQARCAPSLQRLAGMSGCHPNVVAQHLQALQDAGVIERRYDAELGLTTMTLVAEVAEAPIQAGARSLRE